MERIGRLGQEGRQRNRREIRVRSKEKGGREMDGGRKHELEEKKEGREELSDRVKEKGR